MANQNTTHTLTVNLQGAPQAQSGLSALQQQAQAAAHQLQQAQATLQGLNAQMAHFQSMPNGATISQGQMAQAIALPAQIATAQQAVTTAQTNATSTQNAYNTAQQRNQQIQQQVAATMARTSAVMAASQNQQRQYNTVLQNAVTLQQQLNAAINGMPTALQNAQGAVNAAQAANAGGIMGGIGNVIAGASAGAQRVAAGIGSVGSAITGGGASSQNMGYASYAARQSLYGLASSTNIPGAGIGAGIAADAGSALMDALPAPAKAAVGVGMLGIGVSLAKATADAMMTNMGQELGSVVALGPGQTRRSFAEGIMSAGSDFVVPMDQNTQHARSMAQAGVTAPDISGALRLAYASSAQTGADLGSSVSMVTDLMVKQKMGLDGAAKSLQQYANAAAAAHIPMQRMYDMLRVNEQSGASLQTNEGQLASLQAQLGLGVNPAQLLTPANTATGFQKLAFESMLGVSAGQFTDLQHNSAQMFDKVAQFAKQNSGGNPDVLAGLLTQAGMDTSGLTPDQVKKLTDMIMTGSPTQAYQYYKNNVQTQANAPTQGYHPFVSHQQQIRSDSVVPTTKATTAAQYNALRYIEHPEQATNDFLKALGLGQLANAPIVKDPGGSLLPIVTDPTGPTIRKAGGLFPYINHILGGQKSTPPPQPPTEDIPSNIGNYDFGTYYNVNGKQVWRWNDNGTTQQPSTHVQGLYELPNDQKALKKAIPAGARPYLKDFQKAAAATGIPVEILIAQAQAESNFNPHAVSGGGAIGIAQFMPATAKALGIDPNNPHQSIAAQARYDKQLWQQVGSLPGALASYNEGPTAFLKGQMPAETAQYLATIAANTQKITAAEKVNVHVDVTVHNDQGQTLPSRTTTRPAPTSAHLPGPGQRRP